MKLYDITIPIASDMPVYPGDPQVSVERVESIEDGAANNLTRLSFGTHTGTHIDAPRHFIEKGTPVDQLSLEILMGRVLVEEISGVSEITREILARLPLRGHTRLIIKTDNSALWSREGFVERYAHLTEAGARYLVEQGLKLVGIDYLSIERFNGTGNVHRVLLENNVVVLEGLNLHGVPEGEYELICLPLKIKNGDGAPARALLRGSASRATDFDPHSTRWPLA